MSFTPWNFPPLPLSLSLGGGAGADTQIPRLSFLAKSIFHRVDGSRKRRCLAAMRQWEVRVGCRRKKRNAPPRWTEAVKQWRSLAEEEGEILACCFMSRSFIPICFFVFFNITLFPFFPAARPLPSLRKLSSPPPPAKVNSQPVCRNIGGGRLVVVDGGAVGGEFCHLLCIHSPQPTRAGDGGGGGASATDGRLAEMTSCVRRASGAAILYYKPLG